MDIKTRISHLFQLQEIQEIENLNVNKVLEIGIGDGHLSSYLQRLDYDVTTVDIDKDKNPDIVADIRTYEPDDYDVICMFEILEHIDYKEALKVLEKMKNHAKYILISVPQGRIYFDISITFSGIKRLFGKHIASLHINFPLRSKSKGEHKWELNREVKRKQFRKMLKKNFTILKEYKVPLNSYHTIFVLRSN